MQQLWGNLRVPGGVHHVNGTGRGVALAIALVTILAASGPGTSSAVGSTRSMKYGCASAEHGVRGVLHFLGRPSRCRGAGKIAVEFGSDAPVHVCVSRARGRVGLVKLVDDPARCKSSGLRGDLVRTLPRSSRTSFCARRATGALRWVGGPQRCSGRELRVVLSKGAHAPPALLFDEMAPTDEDHHTLVPVRGGRQPYGLHRRVRLESLDPSGTIGRVRVTKERTIVYDPAGRFDRLKPGDTAVDGFAYRATDGVHRTRSRVVVELTGVNDAPVADGDSASTTEDPSGPLTIDVIKSAAAAGTPGKDADPEGDPLNVASFDAATDKGALVSANGDGSLDYNPAGSFEALGAGQTETDSFRYRAADLHGSLSNEAVVSVTVAGENDRPLLPGLEGFPARVVAGPIVSPATNHVSDSIAVSDVDRNPGLGGALMSGATVRVSSGLDTAQHDTLEYTPRNGIAGAYEPATGTLTLSGSASPADYQAALRSVAFTTDDDAPTADRTFSFQVDDGAAQDHLSSVVTRDLHVSTSRTSVTAQPSLVPAFSREASDYAVRCSGAPLSIAVNAPDGTQVVLDGRAALSGEFSTSVDLAAGQSFRFVVTRGSRSDTYHVRCLPLDFPQYEATVAGTPQAQWYFVTPTSNYAVIFNADGVPVWWKKAESRPFNFKLLSDGNVGFASVWNGSPGGQFNELSLDGTLVRSTDTHGPPPDFHDYAELPNGDRYMLSYWFRDHVDVSAYTGKSEDTDAAVLDAEIQELAPDGSLVWSWNSKDHIGLDETGRWWDPSRILTARTDDGRNVYDIVHINSVEPDGNGVVISMRHTDALYRIDRATGGITWKLGGTSRPESLTIVGDDANSGVDFGGQHDARILPDSSLTLHDNGTARGRAPRALRFQLDTAARTATLVESISDPLATSSGCCGSARKLPGGNWVVSWGQNNLVTELTPSGERPFKLTFGPGAISYRAAPVLPGVLSAADLRAGMEAQYPRP